MENQEKTEVKVKERKEWMGPGTKTALGALIMGVASILCVLTISSSDSFTTSGEPMAGAAVAAVAAGVVVAAGVAGMAVVAGVAVAAVMAGAAGAAGAALVVLGVVGVAVIIAWDKKEERALIIPSMLLYLVFVLPFFITITPLSKYHNYRQLERDRKIVEILELKVLEDEVMILLPENYVGENSYLKKVFSFGWEGEKNKKRWGEIAIPCPKGDNYCYEAKLPFSKKKTEVARLELFFGHAYQNYTGTKQVSLK